MGYALRKLENLEKMEIQLRKFPRKVRKLSMISMENQHLYNNLDNYDDYYKVLISKSNALREYLDRNKLENIEKVEPMTIRLVEKVENKYLDIKEAAKHLDCDPKTIRNRIKTGMPYEKSKNKIIISQENLEKWKDGKPENIEIPILEDLEPEVENIETVDNPEVEEYIPVITENFVTRDELNSYTVALKDFTEAIGQLRQEISTVRTAQEEMKKQKEEENLIARIEELDKKIAAVREKQQQPLWKKVIRKIWRLH